MGVEDLSSLEQELKELIVTSLKLEDVTPSDIESEKPLFLDGLGLDSIDALELATAIVKKYRIKMDGDVGDYQHHFASVQNLAKFVNGKLVTASTEGKG